MVKRLGISTAAVLVLALAIALGLHACGDDSNNRDRTRCEVCDPTDIDGDCVEQCQRFCSATEDCATRCRDDCDQCRAELRCAPCVAQCTGTASRCVRVGEPITCEDGQF